MYNSDEVAGVPMNDSQLDDKMCALLQMKAEYFVLVTKKRQSRR